MFSFLNIFKSSTKINTNNVKSVRQQNETVKENITANRLPRALQVAYKQEFENFDSWLSKNRQHQKEAIECSKTSKIGQFSLPTGCGKSRVQIALHVSKMIEMTKNDEFGIFVIGAHRLTLCSQLLTELITVAVNCGLPFDILFIGSDRFSEDKVHCKFKNKGFNSYVNQATSTTNSSDVLNAVNKAYNNKRHVICVSTYHSFDKLNKLDTISMVTYDEAHTLISDEFLDNIKLIQPKVEYNYFFTATRKVRGTAEGMNNESIFGKVLYEVSPRKMIEAGEIVGPRLHIIQTEDNEKCDNHLMLVKTVITGFEQHKYFVKEGSVNQDMIGAKLLISTSGTLEMFNLYNDPDFMVYCRENKIKAFAFSSVEGIFYNFKKISRQEALEKMAELKDEEDAILLHIEILTEGIDLPSITGVMPFRELNTVKLLQTIGRGARLLKQDREDLYKGTLNPRDWDNYIKPFVWVIFPEHYSSLGNAKAMKNTIRDIVRSYEVPVEEYTVKDLYLAEQDEDLPKITENDYVEKVDVDETLVHIIEEIVVEEINNHKKKSSNPLEYLFDYFGR